jgi:ABC-type sugar transport system ATPase subunit
VILARCLAVGPSVLILCEPTAGVDIGTRVAIYQIIADLAANGLTVVLASSDEGDLLALCTRILVLRDGIVAEELAADGLTKNVLIRAIEGAEQ